MKKIATLILLSCLAALSSRADVIYQELFNYSNGPVAITSTNGTGSTTISNWITHSGNQDCFVNNRRLEVSTSPARSGDVNRQFSMTNGSPYTNVQQVIYVSFVVNFTNLPAVNGTYFAHFKFGVPSSSSFEGRVFAEIGNPAQPTNNFAAQPNTFRLGVSTSAQSASPNKIFPIDLALNADYQVVLGWDPVTLNAVSLWVNPLSSTDYSVTASDAYTPGLGNIANCFAFRQATGFAGFLTVSNLVVSTTFDEAFTNVLATNAVAPKIVYQPVGLTNFVGASVALSSVSVGQGLAGLTYQWFKNNALFSNPDGNTNVLAFASAQATDSGNYKVAVTTPYGLSVTSSVATVLISSAPVPPSFITQPVSQTAYTAQTVILSTTVSSPGNVNYQWFSNNVAIAGANASTLELDNVQTNFSASYKVAVTNDVVVNGVVSSNAVLTVLNPPSVSIAFLRTLVDPNNAYQATNTTTPFQVTGIITTYSTLTPGNNASYYLQDATAGINIFATFGSTFRPAQGDVVTFVGVLSSFSSGLELFADTTTRPYTSYSIISNNFPLPTPLSIPFTITNNNFSNMNYTIAGKLVKLSNVFFGTNAGLTLPASAVFITVTNGLGQPFNLWFSSVDNDTTNQVLPAFASSVTGVMFGSMNPPTGPNFAVAVTKFADIDTSTPTVPIPLGVSFAGGNVTFNWTDPSFNLQTATNLFGPWSTIPGAASGFITNITTDPEWFFRLKHP